MGGYSEYTQSALEILRNPQATMHWYVVPLLLITMYIVQKQLHEKNYKVALAVLIGAIIIDCGLVAVAFRDFLRK